MTGNTQTATDDDSARKLAQNDDTRTASTAMREQLSALEAGAGETALAAASSAFKQALKDYIETAAEELNARDDVTSATLGWHNRVEGPVLSVFLEDTRSPEVVGEFLGLHYPNLTEVSRTGNGFRVYAVEAE